MSLSILCRHVSTSKPQLDWRIIELGNCFVVLRTTAIKTDHDPYIIIAIIFALFATTVSEPGQKI